VVPIEKKSPEDGFEILVNPEDLFASPSGWHSDGTNNGTTTSGNNAFSFKTRTSGVTAHSSEGLNFVFNYNLRQNPTAAQNLNAARTNAFYVVNTMHVGQALVSFSVTLTQSTGHLLSLRIHRVSFQFPAQQLWEGWSCQ